MFACRGGYIAFYACNRLDFAYIRDGSVSRIRTTLEYTNLPDRPRAEHLGIPPSQQAQFGRSGKEHPRTSEALVAEIRHLL